MSVARSVAEVLAEHVTLEVEGIDRMYLNVYVPQLQREGGVASFFRVSLWPPVRLQRSDGPDQQELRVGAGTVGTAGRDTGDPFPQRGNGRTISRLSNEEVSKPEGVVFIGKAQEKVAEFRTLR